MISVITCDHRISLFNGGTSRNFLSSTSVQSKTFMLTSQRSKSSFKFSLRTLSFRGSSRRQHHQHYKGEPNASPDHQQPSTPVHKQNIANGLTSPFIQSKEAMV